MKPVPNQFRIRQMRCQTGLELVSYPKNMINRMPNWFGIGFVSEKSTKPFGTGFVQFMDVRMAKNVRISDAQKRLITELLETE